MDAIRDSLAQPRRVLRLLIILTGVVLVVVGVMADQLGFGHPGGLGIGQVLLIIVGLATVVVALLGKRTIDLYKSLAIVLVNTLVLLVLLELGSIVLMRSGLIRTFQESVRAESQEVPYYAAQDWSETYWREAPQAEDYRYDPFVVWSHNPHEGETINVSQDGNRLTPGAACNDDSYKVFVFGGSTMWGWGAPDWGTIPAFLQEGLSNRIDRPICVVNYAEDGFVSTQSVITLMKLLQSGKVPDQVVFYDGVNDVYAAYETGLAGVHPTLESIATKFEERQNPLVEFLLQTRLYALAESLTDSIMQSQARESALTSEAQSKASTVDELADSVAEVYLNNYRIVSALAQEYGFGFRFFWQPHLAVDVKSLSQDERRIQSGIDQTLTDLADATYQRIAFEAENHENLWYIADIFDGLTTQLWIDGWGHVTPEANRLVAEEMLTTLENQLAGQ